MSKIEDMVCTDLQTRAQVGYEKYGTTMERTDLNVMQWAQHTYEELLDGAVYLKKFMSYNEPSHDDYLRVIDMMIKKFKLSEHTPEEINAIKLKLSDFNTVLAALEAEPQQLTLPDE